MISEASETTTIATIIPAIHVLRFAEKPCRGLVSEGQVAGHRRPHHHRRYHEQCRDREIQKVEHADDQREGDCHHHVQATEHQPVNKLLK